MEEIILIVFAVIAVAGACLFPFIYHKYCKV